MLVVLPAEAELAAEHIQQHQHDDDQQHHGEHAAASAAASFDYGRMFAFDVVASSAMETLPVLLF